MIDNLATLHFDTHKVVKLLQEKGYSETEAEGFIQAVQEITLFGVATKQDLQEVKDELKKDIADLQVKTDSLDKRLSVLEEKVGMLIWMVGINMTMTTGILLAIISGIIG